MLQSDLCDQGLNQIIFDFISNSIPSEYLLVDDSAVINQFITSHKAVYIQPEIESDETVSSDEFSDCMAKDASFPSKKSKVILSFESNLAISAVIKTTQEITGTSDLFVINLPREKLYSTICDYIHYAITPFIKTQQGQGIELTLKKLAELELSLQHLQQNLQIPTVTLKTHPLIMSVTEQEKDSTFLNEIQSHVNLWIKEIQKVTLLDRQVSSGTAQQEIEFWIQMERSLQQIELSLKQPEIQKTLSILKAAKRFHATVSFIADTGIKETTEKVLKYNVLMKDFPINELLTASDFEKIQHAIKLIFTHFIKKLKLCPYPIARALPLCEAISDDLNAQLLKVLQHKSLFYIDFQHFEELMNQLHSVFDCWQENVNEFISVGRDVTRKRLEPFIPVKVQSRHLLLQERILFIEGFRTQHEQLLQTIKKVGNEELGNLEDVNSALDSIKSINCLDVTPDGVELWHSQELIYNEKISKIEQHIITKLKDCLKESKTATDMFRIFSKYNSLFIRPKIRGAIHEYQSQLLDRVKVDIEKLVLKFTKSHTRDLTVIRDIPSVSGSIIWARSVELKLDGYMKNVANVLGSGWEEYIQGQKLLQESLSFKRKLSTTQIFEKWKLTELERQRTTGFIFNLQKQRMEGNNFVIGVNFDESSIDVFKEVRNLQYLGFQIPSQIQLQAKHSKKIYPVAVSLLESLRIYKKTLKKMHDNNVGLLVGGHCITIQGLISKGVNNRWEDFLYDKPETMVFVREFAISIQQLEEKTQMASQKTIEVDNLIKSLETCKYESETFESIIQKIQRCVDRLQDERFSNLQIYCLQIDRNIEDVVRKRLTEALEEWNDGLVFQKIQAEPLISSLKMRNFQISLDPPVEKSRGVFIDYLFQWMTVVLGLPRIKVFKYLVKDGTYSSVLRMVDQAVLKKSYFYIDKMINDLQVYVDRWLQYQSLWDLEANVVFEKLGDDLVQWSNVLIQVRKQRDLLDTTKTVQNFEAITVDFSHIQTKVNAQYDTWQRDLISRFSLKLTNAFQKFFKEIKSSRIFLEELTFSGSIDSIVCAIEKMHRIGRLEVRWTDTLNTLEGGQKILERQRYTFSNDWIYYDQLQGEFSAFKEIYKRKMILFDECKEMVQNRVIQANKTSYNEINSLITDWDIKKPVKLDPTTALKKISEFESRFDDQKQIYNMLCKAKVVLNLDFITFDGIIPTMEELLDHKLVLENLSSIWLELDKLRNYFWCAQSETGHELDLLISKLKKMPNRMRQYTVFQSLLTKIEQFKKINAKSLPLKSEAIKDRHWNLIFSLFNLDSNRSVLKVGQVWDSIPNANEKELDKIIQAAQGELALEEYLQTIKKFWDTCKFEFVGFQNLKLVKTFVEISSKTTDNLMVLQQMKTSPYFKTVQVKAEELEIFLNKLYFLIEVWQNVQQKWIYLQGVFGGENIKRILPIESTRFQRIDTEYTSLVRRTFKSPCVTEVLMIPNILNVYERLWDLLVQVQKSLGEYLEKERDNFKRFYFLSDDDLLEILGSKDIHGIQPLLKKMFPGISDLIIEDEILGVVSKEAEEVRFSRKIAYQSRLVYEWLADVELEVMSTLSDLLLESIAYKSIDFSETVALENFKEWLDSYPCQIILLTSQCQFSTQAEKSILGKNFERLLLKIETRIEILAKILSQDLESKLRSKSESLITELIHQRDIARKLCRENVSSITDYSWLKNMRFYSVGKKVFVDIANARFEYGFEYLGIQANLVETPLTDKCFLTLCQALDNKLGGSPFGPAGTGKTESVKALASKLGRYCLVFCCDEGFDFQSIGRIFIGLCSVGAYGCFDEFNRLEEKILSAVSQQIQSIQIGLKTRDKVELVGKDLLVNPNTAIFITMNPGYAGRSNLPENLTSLFRSVAMTTPDRLIIAQVMLFSQGFATAEQLSQKVVPFFEIVKEQLSNQKHYDFGLRALKSVLFVAGKLKRTSGESEEMILIQSIRETVFPKLVKNDVELASM